jgi:hypothetical protein
MLVCAAGGLWGSCLMGASLFTDVRFGGETCRNLQKCRWQRPANQSRQMVGWTVGSGTSEGGVAAAGVG